MKWNRHSKLEGAHAYLGASQHSWLNYSEDQLIARYHNSMAKLIGTRKHILAKELIELGVPLKNTHTTLNMYVNDALKYRMSPETVLYYSDNCFGTADAICYNEKTRFLRIHDLKTGAIPAHMEQLEIYMALFCLEYDKNPKDIQAELRIYQNDDILVHEPIPERIMDIENKIIKFDSVLEQLKINP